MKPVQQRREFNRKITQFEKLALSCGADFCKDMTDDDCPGGSVYKLQVLLGAAQLVNAVTVSAELQSGSMIYHIVMGFIVNTTNGDFDNSHEIALGFTTTLSDEMNRYIDTPDDKKDQFEWFDQHYDSGFDSGYDVGLQDGLRGKEEFRSMVHVTG